MNGLKVLFPLPKQLIPNRDKLGLRGMSLDLLLLDQILELILQRNSQLIFIFFLCFLDFILNFFLDRSDLLVSFFIYEFLQLVFQVENFFGLSIDVDFFGKFLL